MEEKKQEAVSACVDEKEMTDDSVFFRNNHFIVKMSGCLSDIPYWAPESVQVYPLKKTIELDICDMLVAEKPMSLLLEMAKDFSVDLTISYLDRTYETVYEVTYKQAMLTEYIPDQLNYNDNSIRKIHVKFKYEKTHYEVVVDE